MPVRILFSIFLLLSFGAPAQSFVQTRDGHFYLKGSAYYYAGANYWYGGLLAQGADRANGVARLQSELDFLKANGITNLRLLAGSEGSGLINGVQRVGPALQPEQGIFNESVLAGLDQVLAEMGKRHMKAVLMLSNNWEWSGGFLQYLNWNGRLPDSIMRRKLSWDEFQDYVSQFYSCTPCTTAYQEQIGELLARRNTVNRKRYVDDPTIMTWELANEPRPMRPEAEEAYAAWIRNTAAFIRQRAPKQMICLGHEGFIGTKSMALYESIHRDPNIDYLTIHIWPKNWAWFRSDSMANDFSPVLAKTKNYIKEHLDLAVRLGKPLVIEEFGFPRDGLSFDTASGTELRDEYFRLLFAEWKASADRTGAVAGVNFWAFGGSARPVPGQAFWKTGDPYMGDPPMEEQGLNTVFDCDHSTWNLIRSFTLKRRPKRPPAN